jgi:hypothetical protein
MTGAGEAGEKFVRLSRSVNRRQESLKHEFKLKSAT